ncbi:hypothetical protein P70_0092 [Listeria phage P70]|uniref:Uncharacterized protein n=1 Tax=Listeria phage P70 TaxID=1225800 RepID=J9QQJ3_9CAUD|nr:hypothetical protein P70_0092 [Listeria phage P70]AFQ96281.1 hypothetical protein P70_0092 [Listeria phage P70]
MGEELLQILKDAYEKYWEETGDEGLPDHYRPPDVARFLEGFEYAEELVMHYLSEQKGE